MIAQFFSLGLLMLFSAMLPGPDFAIVTKNTVLHSRRAGFFTTFGIGAAIIVHLTYCVLGLALIISQSILLFNTIKFVGAGYLIYLGIQSLLTKQVQSVSAMPQMQKKTTLSAWVAFRQGFFCNLLNPKATLFFLALFTIIIKPETPLIWEVIYAVEMLVIAMGWFCTLTMILSHPRVMQLLDRAEKYIMKVLGVFLVGFGVALAFVRRT